MTTTHTLRNVGGWVYTYAVAGNQVTVKGTYRGSPVGSMSLSRSEAREHYRGKLATGYTTLAGNL